MTREEFDALVRRVENEFADRPAALRWRVVCLALLGYAGLLAWLGVIVLISAGFFILMIWVDVEVKIACAIIGLTVLFGGGYAALRALLVKVNKPEGRPVTRAEVPELFALLDTLQSELRSQPFHQVLIVPECNAGVVQVPRLGVLGWQRNYLMIGLPLIDGLSRDEMRAVLAHEFTHLSREHGRLTHWLYRLRRSWQDVFQQLSRPRVRGEFSLRPLLVKFIEFFWPRFNAHAFVLSRANEYEADAQSARLTGNINAASALMHFNIVQSQLTEKVWPDVFRLANDQPQPPEDILLRVRNALCAGPTSEDAAKWLEQSLKITSTNSDTHPCLKERLAALNAAIPAAPPGPTAPTAAEALLGPALDSIRADVQKRWCKEIAPKWRERHARAGALKERIHSIEQSAAASNADVDRLWDKAIALLDLEGGQAATPLLRQIVESRPDHVLALFHLGRLLLQENSSEGIAHLEHAMTLDEHLVPQACGLLHNYYRLSGAVSKIRELDARMDRHEKSLAASHKERCEVTANDSFIPHGLTEVELAPVRNELEPELRILRAHLARKELKYFPTQRLFVLCVYPRRAWHGFANDDLDRALIRRLSQKLQLPGRLIVIAPSGHFRALAKKVSGVTDVEIFRRK